MCMRIKSQTTGYLCQQCPNNLNCGIYYQRKLSLIIIILTNIKDDCVGNIFSDLIYRTYSSVLNVGLQSCYNSFIFIPKNNFSLTECVILNILHLIKTPQSLFQLLLYQNCQTAQFLLCCVLLYEAVMSTLEQRRGAPEDWQGCCGHLLATFL